MDPDEFRDPSGTVAFPRLRAYAAALGAQFGAMVCYVFWTGSGGTAGSGEARRTRTLLAFASPDLALAFAQRNNLAAESTVPRLRRLTMEQLVLAVGRSTSIGAVVLVYDDELPPAGQLPRGLSIRREALLEQIGAASNNDSS